MESVLQRCWGRNLPCAVHFNRTHYLRSSGLLFLLTFFWTITFAQFNCPNASRCTSKDLSIVGARLVGGACACSATGTQTADLKMSINNTTGSLRTSFAFFGTLVFKTGSNTDSTRDISGCGGSLPPNTITEISVGVTITYGCSETLSLTNVYLAWTDASGTTAARCADILADACVHIAPKCGTAPVIPITPLLSLSADTSKPCNSNSDGSITIHPLGGKPKYNVTLKGTPDVTHSNVDSAGSTQFTGLSAGTYTFVVTDAVSCTYSSQVTLTSKFCCTSPTITVNPNSTSACAGDSVFFTAGATGGSPAPTVQWQISTAAGGNTFVDLTEGSPYKNVTSTTLRLKTSSSLNGFNYRAVFTSAGCPSTNGNAATLTVDAATVAGTVAAAQTICYNTSPNDLTLSGKTGNVVKWQKSTDNFVTNSTDIANTTTTLSPGALTQDTWFRAVVQSGVCPSATSNAVKISVDAATVAGTVAAAQTICYNSSPNDLTLSGKTGNVVKWQKSTDNFVLNSTDIANTTTSLSPGALTQDTWFRAVVQNGVCPSATTSAVKITVDAATVAGTVSAAQTICSNSTPNDLTLSGKTGNVVKWQKSTDNFVSNITDIANTTTTLSPGTLTQDTWFRAVVKNGTCPEASTSPVKITVGSIPALPAFTITEPSLCGTGTGSINFCTTQTGFTYTVGNKSPISGNGNAQSVTGLAAGSNPSIVVTNTTGNCQNTFSCSQSISSCPAGPVARVALNTTELNQQPTVKAYPNPFSDKINFVVTTPISGKGRLEVYNMMGQKVRTVYQGFISAGTQTFQMSSERHQVANLIYVLRIDDKKISGRILQINQ